MWFYSPLKYKKEKYLPVKVRFKSVFLKWIIIKIWLFLQALASDKTPFSQTIYSDFLQ